MGRSLTNSEGAVVAVGRLFPGRPSSISTFSPLHQHSILHDYTTFCQEKEVVWALFSFLHQNTNSLSCLTRSTEHTTHQGKLGSEFIPMHTVQKLYLHWQKLCTNASQSSPDSIADYPKRKHWRTNEKLMVAKAHGKAFRCREIAARQQWGTSCSITRD